MAKNPNNAKSRFDKALKYAAAADATGSQNDRLLGLYYHGLAAGSEKTAGKSSGLLDNFLTKSAILSQFNTVKRNDIRPLRQEEGIILGTEVTTGFKVGLRFEELPLATCLISPPGGGKTNINLLILSQLPKGVVKIFIDSKRESSRFGNRFGHGIILRPNQWYDNPMEAIGDPVESRLSRLEHLAAHLNIDDRSWRDIPMLLADVEGTMPAGLQKLSFLEMCFVLEEAGKAHNAKYGTVASRLWPLARTLGERARVVTGPDIFSQYDWVALDYTGVNSTFRNALHACMLDKMVQQFAAKGHSNILSTAIFWDDALDAFGKEHSSTRPGSGYVSYQRTISAQGRSYGLLQFKAIQHPSQVDKSGTADNSNVIVPANTDYEEARECSRLLGEGDKLTEEIQHLPLGQAFLRTPTYRRAIRITVPLVPLGSYRGVTTMDAETSEDLSRLKSQTIFSPERPGPRYSINYSDVFPNTDIPQDDSLLDIRAEHRIFVAEVFAHPNASIVEHYRNLGWSGGRGHRVKNQLVANNILASQKQESPNGRPVEILVLTEKGKRYFDDNSQS